MNWRIRVLAIVLIVAASVVFELIVADQEIVTIIGLVSPTPTAVPSATPTATDTLVPPSLTPTTTPTAVPTDTPTPIPTGWRGTIEYRIAVGDTLELIALRYFSTVESILQENADLDNANEIFVGQIIVVRVNIATPVPTDTPRPSLLTPTATP